MTSAKVSDFLTPLVRKFTQPPLLRLLTMSAFEGTPLPPQCRRHKLKPPNETHHAKLNFLKFVATRRGDGIVKVGADHSVPATRRASNCLEGGSE